MGVRSGPLSVVAFAVLFSLAAEVARANPPGPGGKMRHARMNEQHDWGACPLHLDNATCQYSTVAKPTESALLESGIYNHNYFPDTARLVAFASFPHSGNSWLRALIDTLTGYETVECVAAPADVHFLRQPTIRSILIKTHRSPTYPDLCPIYFNSNDEQSVPPNAVLHLVRNPIDTFFSLGIVRKRYGFNPNTGYLWAKGNLWLDHSLQHMQYWTDSATKELFAREDESGDRVVSLRLRYEDALDDPHLTLRAIRAFMWRAHRPEHRTMLQKPFNHTLLDLSLGTYACKNLGASKCITGGSTNIGKRASCFSPPAIMTVLQYYQSTLDLLGYDVHQTDCEECKNPTDTSCKCYCPLELTVKHDKLYSGIVGPDRTVVKSLKQLVEETEPLMGM